MFDALTILAIAGTFLLAGTVKGVIGLGLPTVSLALLTVAIDLPHAMALLLVPSFITNLWQAAVGGNGGAILRRLWPFLLMATGTVWLGATALTRVDLSLLSALLGAASGRVLDSEPCRPPFHDRNAPGDLDRPIAWLGERHI